jgi:hypothetical protein
MDFGDSIKVQGEKWISRPFRDIIEVGGKEAE